MKKKVIAGVVAAVVAILLLFLQFYPAVMEIAVMFFAVLANMEILRTVGVKNRGIFVVTTLAAAVIPWNARYDLLAYTRLPVEVLLLIYVFLLLILMLARYDVTRFEHVAVASLSSLALPYAISTLLKLSGLYRAIGGQYTRSNCSYLLLFALVCAWVTDTMAYFSGSKFGKHKMCPKISPKKSWEGAVGGVLGTAGVNVLIWLVYFGLARGGVITPLFIPLWVVPPVSVALSVLAMLGDLTFSAIKRNYGVKDFGTIMGEGNGGVMDRFDSASFVLPAMYFMVLIYEKLR